MIRKAGTIAIALLSSSALAQDNALVLEEVIVTAQKKLESVNDTPMTVNVISGEDMNAYANFNFQDIDKMSAGVVVSGSGFDGDIAVRGMGTNMTAAVTPRVTVYLDGAFITQERGIFSSLYDLNRFELLRGPQGTLYGRSSPAGAIIVQSQGPNLEEVDGYIQQAFNEHDSSNTQFGVSIPLIEGELGLRLAGLYDTNENTDAQNITLNRDLSNESWSGRGVLYWMPNDRFDARLSYTRIEDDFDIDPMVRGGGFKPEDRIAVNEYQSDMENTSEYTVLELNWTLPNEWTLTSVSSYQDNETDRKWDPDGSEVRGSEQIVSSNIPDGWGTELRLASIGNNSLWDWTVGAYYQDSDSNTPVFNNTYIAPNAFLDLVAVTTGPAAISETAWAVFSHNAIHLSDETTLTLGLRYNDSERDQAQPFVINAYLVDDIDRQNPIATIIQDGIALEDQHLTDNAITGTVKLQHNFTDELMLYAAYDRGWRDGSANVAGRAEPNVFSGFDAEDSDNFEAGFKWSFWENRAQLNMTAYYQIYDNFQYQVNGVDYVLPASDGGGTSLTYPIVNVDEAESYGVEAEMHLLLSEFWTAHITGSYNQTELTDAKNVPCTSDVPLPPVDFSFNTCDLTGKRAGRVPEWSGIVTSEYWQPLDDTNLQWYVRGLLKSESAFYSNSLDQDLDSYTTLDLFTGLRNVNAGWDISVWARNILDEEAVLDELALEALPDFDNGGSYPNPYTHVRAQLDPRTVGITGSYRF